MMVVRRDGHQNRVYYHCSKYFRPRAENPCNYGRFVPGTWDDLVWDLTCALLSDDAWSYLQLASGKSKDGDIANLVRLQQSRISQAQARMAKVHEGFEGSIYSLNQAKLRIAELEDTIATAGEEIRRLQKETKRPDVGAADMEAVTRELEALREDNLGQAGFEEKLECIPQRI